MIETHIIMNSSQKLEVVSSNEYYDWKATDFKSKINIFLAELFTLGYPQLVKWLKMELDWIHRLGMQAPHGLYIMDGDHQWYYMATLAEGYIASASKMVH